MKAIGLDDALGGQGSKHSASSGSASAGVSGGVGAGGVYGSVGTGSTDSSDNVKVYIDVKDKDAIVSASISDLRFDDEKDEVTLQRSKSEFMQAAERDNRAAAE